MDTIPEEQKDAIYPIDNTNIGQGSNNSFAPIFDTELKDSTMTNSF